MYHLIWWWCCCCWTRAPRIALLYYCRGNGNDGPVYAPGGLFTSPRLNRCAFENGLIPIRAQLISKRCFHPQNVIKLHGNTNRNVAMDGILEWQTTRIGSVFCWGLRAKVPFCIRIYCAVLCDVHHHLSASTNG